MPDDQEIFLLPKIQRVLQSVAMLGLVGVSLSLTVLTALGAAGAVPMLSVPASIGINGVDAGPLLQTGAAVTLLALLALLPGSAKVRQLEASHRSFQIGMEDVTRAYWAAHAADRVGIFQMSREFDAVRERFEFLRQHPELSEHEPELLELAAQMSTEARDLARIYSDEKVARAEAMLVERKAEAKRLTQLIDRAHQVSRDMRRRLAEVEMDEDVVRSRIGALREELESIWTELDASAPERVGPTLRLAAE
jgi:hypothetical protein